MNMSQIVMDTNVFVSALLSADGIPHKIYQKFLSGEVTLITCPAIIEEYEDVIYRPLLKIAKDDADMPRVHRLAERTHTSLGLPPKPRGRFLWLTREAKH